MFHFIYRLKIPLFSLFICPLIACDTINLQVDPQVDPELDQDVQVMTMSELGGVESESESRESECPNGEPISIFYYDEDGDGVGDQMESIFACERPTGYASDWREPETNCDGEVDECGVCGGDGAEIYYADQDQDGAGDPLLSVSTCSQPEGFVENGEDPQPLCATDDEDECGVCGGEGAQLYYADQDQDGVGDSLISLSSCVQPEGFVESGEDPQPFCATDDEDECGVCGGEGARLYYADQDQDGRGDTLTVLSSCHPPEGFVEQDGDPQPLCATDNEDQCGVCDGGGQAVDCLGVCFGEAFVDGCERCVDGTSGREAAVSDYDQDLIPDLCDSCFQSQPRVLIEWSQVPSFGINRGGPYTFQVALYDDGSFYYLYQQVEPLNPSQTIGYQGPNGDPYLALGVDSHYLEDHHQIFFRPSEGGRPEVDYAVDLPWFELQRIEEGISLGDDSFFELELPFEFPIFGESYDRIWIGSNGVISFSQEGQPTFNNTSLPNFNYGAFLAPFWDDLNPTTGGQVYWRFDELPCQQDCAGQFGGDAVLDDCGICADGASGHVYNETIDCMGICGGEAEVDICEVCAGGTSGLTPSSPADCPYAPDLIVDQAYLASTLLIEEIQVDDPCLIEELCVGGLGQRKVLRFGTRIANIGNSDLQLGAPSEELPHWHWDDCHGHFHYDEYAVYHLFNLTTNEQLPMSAKAGFAVIDIGVYDPELAPNGCVGYNGRNQGISVGCQDTYSRSLRCQWIDITGLANGDYRLEVTTNPIREIDELHYDNNTASVNVRIFGNQVEVIE